MAYLYILAESERDDSFYDLLCERIAGHAFDRPLDFRVRPGSNLNTAMAAARLLLDRVKQWTDKQEIAVVIAVDNDRAPGHPGAESPPPGLVGADRNKAPRYPALADMVADRLGYNRDRWPVDVALAVPVEMIESWVLFFHNPGRDKPLPIFAEARQPLARLYYGGDPPPQLKDLCRQEAIGLGMTLDEFFWKAAERDIRAAALASPSLLMFVEQVGKWRVGGEIS